MIKSHLDCAYLVAKFPYHDKIKSELLQLIDISESTSVVDIGCDTNITRADWHNAQDFKRTWTAFLIQYLTNPVLEMYKELGYDGYTLHELWYQQYYKNSKHGWHTHSANFTNVYYLELPDSVPKTKIVSPYDQKTIIEVDVKEGDILIFPSFVVHKAPVNLTNDRKTIVSYNINATYSNEIYGKGLE